MRETFRERPLHIRESLNESGTLNYANNLEPRKNLFGLFAVVTFHIALIYALANGLASKVIAVLKPPLTVSVIEEIKTLPPPPPPKTLPPPKAATPPPPAYVPPPEVAVQAPPQETIVATSATPAPEPVPAAVAVPVAPPIVNAAVACPNSDSVRSHVPYPPQAERMNISGNVLVEFTVGAEGEVKNVSAIHSSNSLFANTATKAVAEFRCNGQGHDVRVRVPFDFRIN
ncbi:MAG: periplasmic biopolymer transport protein linking inner and outer rane [Nevskia sp.]|nr:periplasmic biopolymer transport protein linking inner and outer rane [Nevskia sp.]